MCPRCSQHELTLGHSCCDDSLPCKVCGRSRVVVVTRHDSLGTLSENQPCLACMTKAKK